MTPELALGSRLAKSPFFDATIAAGAARFTVYNHMLMPVSYGDPEAEYRRLIETASIWDVACQVQVELAGPDAGALAQAVVCRDLSNMAVGQAKYAPMADHAGRLINDPLLLRVGERRWWLSLADSDMVFWCRAIAAERELDVSVSLPDVSPLAVQGPNAEDVVADLLGEWVRDLRLFRFRRADIEGIALWVGRAGWSGQDGFELYLIDGARGGDLWRLVIEAGAPHGIGPGAPNAVERVESFMLSYRADTIDDCDPFEARLERFVDLDAGVDFIGRAALQQRRASGLRRQLVGLIAEGEPIAPAEEPWPVTSRDEPVGGARAAVHSPRLARNIALALVDVPHNTVGGNLWLHSPNGVLEARGLRSAFRGCCQAT